MFKVPNVATHVYKYSCASRKAQNGTNAFFVNTDQTQNVSYIAS